MAIERSEIPVTPKEAHEALCRFVASHFRKIEEHARFSIPVNLDRDDDVRLSQFIDQYETMAKESDELKHRAEAAENELRTIIKAREPKEHPNQETIHVCGGCRKLIAVGAGGCCEAGRIPVTFKVVAACGLDINRGLRCNLPVGHSCGCMASYPPMPPTRLAEIAE